MASTGKKHVLAPPVEGPVEGLLALHRTMVRLRAADAVADRLSRQGRIGLHVSSMGLEALLAGVASELREADWLFPGLRHAGIALARGVPATTYFAQVLGCTADPCRGRQEPGHLASAPFRVASISTPPGRQLPHAVGLARAIAYRKRHEVALALAGGASTAGDAFHVALNFAALWRVPAVFVIDSDATLASQTASPGVAVKAKAYGLPATEVDGLDALAVKESVAEAVARARRGEGPTLIEARTASEAPAPRLRVVGAAAEARHLAPADPIDRLELLLRHRGALDEKAAAHLRAEAAAEMRAAADAAARLPAPPVATLFEDVFHRRTPALSAQRRERLDDGS
jgi:TPP-dependent pyruvate/acetoin dehydrogenase alpha subunit